MASEITPEEADGRKVTMVAAIYDWLEAMQALGKGQGEILGEFMAAWTETMQARDLGNRTGSNATTVVRLGA